MLGYSSRNALAINSATLTSIDEYQTTLPSLAAAASIAGVVSSAVAGAATAHANNTAGNAATAQLNLVFFMLLLLSVISACAYSRIHDRFHCCRSALDSTGKAATSLGLEPHPHARPVGDDKVRRRGY